MTAKLRDISKTDEIEYGALTVGEMRELLAYMPSEWTIQAGMPIDGDFTMYTPDGGECGDGIAGQHDFVIFAQDPDTGEPRLVAVFPTKYEYEGDGVWTAV